MSKPRIHFYLRLPTSKSYFIFLLIIISLFFSSCKNASSDNQSTSEQNEHVIVPVKISKVIEGPISQSIDLNATTQFIKRNTLRSSAIGYVNKINIQLGSQIQKDQILFVLKTREAKALGNSLFPNDPSLQFSGLIPMRASLAGYITTINHQICDFVQEGDSLCTIVDQHSLVFILNVPFEWNNYIKMNESCAITLSDGKTFNGRIYSKIAIMDVASQTQKYLVKAETSEHLPENLIARVKLYKELKNNALLVPKSAVLANEEQTEFWVMKLTNDSTAIKIPIKKGIESSDQIELVTNRLKANDMVLISGNYGLSDTATVKIEK